jgi:tetratricopeptide (TPR) repeat protein
MRASVLFPPVTSPNVPRLRLYALVGVAALAAAGATVGITLATRTDVPKTAPPVGARAGAPPLLLELGVRTDPEARALRRAAALYDDGELHRAGLVFGGYHSVEAEVGSALAAWPQGFRELRQLAQTYPRNPLVQLHYGLALYWRGEAARARTAWRAARAAADSPYAIRASDLLYPNFPRGIPIFVPSFRAPAQLDRLSAPRQLAFLERRARAGGARARLLYGVALQRLGHQLSARREYELARQAAPADAEPLVAGAVARFDKANPAAAFSRLGPLARRFPASQSVRFHLGLLLLWLGEVDQAKSQLRRALGSGPASPLGIEARRFLERLETVRTG